MTLRQIAAALLACGVCGSVLAPGARADLSAADITKAVQALVNSLDATAKYGAQDDGTTRCNIFVRDLVNSLLAGSQVELEGKANEQFDALSKSVNWHIMGLVASPEQVLLKAQDLANNGVLVIVAYKNPTAGKPGHIALVVPGVPTKSDTWKIKVPMIAQAGSKGPCQGVPADQSVFDMLKLSCGFRLDDLPNMELFRYGNGK
jgi:hypothetical protein